MKRFLYLNNDTLSSYMSQIEDGLIKNKIEIIKKDIENEKVTKGAIQAAASIDLKILSKGAEANIDSTLETDRKNKDLDSHSNSVEKITFDETIDRLEQYLNNNHYLEKNDDIGCFIKIEEKIHIVDLEYYKHIFSNENVLNFIKNSTISERYNNRVSEIEKTGNGKKAVYDSDKLFKEIKKDVNKEYIEVSNNIDAILNIIPYSKFGIMGDYLISLDEEYFRDKTKVVAFKYGGKMTCLGYLTNIISNEAIPDVSNIFSSFPSIINSIMLTFFHKKEIKIIHPIAIYY